ncbi:MAG: hypothetical protein IH597_12935 [Bacteroidales bacterium]|nr:hypothetical protein [Bacteroidales bacterium]
MRKICLICFLVLPFSVLAAEPGSLQIDEKQDYKRFTWGIIPAAAFDSDLGFKYGAVFNLFDHGSHQKLPLFDQYLYIKLTNTTRGTLNAQAVFESKSLIKNATLILEASYLKDKKMDFFGFNGLNAMYHPALTNHSNPDFAGKFFYAHERDLLRLRADLQKNLIDDKIRLLTGFTHNRFSISPAMEKDAGSEQYGTSLFENYKIWNIIKPEESRGGNINLINFGLIYDTRNEHCFCTDGIWVEAMFIYSPGFMSDADFSKLVLTYRQHASTMNERITFSFRASSQQKLSGDIPFYMLPTYFDSRLSQDGLGGAFNLRGALRNRIVSDGFLAGNFETKFKISDFHLLGQYFYVSLSVFYDNAFVTQAYQTNLAEVPVDLRDFFFGNANQKIHHTFGTGLYIVFNRNNIITVNYGVPVNGQDGPGGLYIGSSLLF